MGEKGNQLVLPLLKLAEAAQTGRDTNRPAR
jgi:hypothetical protein